MRRSLLFQIFPVYLIAMLLAVGLLTLAATRVIRSAFYEEKEIELRSTTLLTSKALGLPSLFTELQEDEIHARRTALSNLVEDLPLRITVISRDGVVIADTHVDADRAENHAERPEVVQALAEGYGTHRRVSSSTSENSLYLAISFADSDQIPVGVVRSAASIAAIDRRVGEAFTAILLTGLLIIVGTTAPSFVVVRRIYSPLMTIQNAADRYAAGELNYRIERQGPEEIQAIADTLNGMAAQLSKTIAGITTQRNELEAILSSMVEGVIVVDQHRRISSINRAAGRLFRVDHEKVIGKSMIEALRNVEIDELASQTIAQGGAQEQGFVIYDSPLTHVQVHATTLNYEGSAGVLLVLNDISKMKQLENIRRDFIANVSHELRTPITSILGFVETLRDGALQDPAAAERFIEIIHGQSVRLNLIIEDLLSLSRLESINSEIPMEVCRIDQVVIKAIQACEHEAGRKEIHIQHSHEGGLPMARVNPALLEQALVNLINNAVKYSPKVSEVRVVTRISESLLKIEVTDQGEGIPRKDIERVFERFYRVDRARSRNVGGTGLGLAIVKHIGIAHGGEVTVMSTEGQGSTFTLHIPQTHSL
ncbi:MAG: PAS domain-containing protein [Spirochaetaceae bacterium]|nr:MAG: PAS domain-containing protein [Spirochaetaceae bacterium]